MLALVRVAVRSFAIGIAVGILVAPRPGEQTRRMLLERASAAVDSLLELAALRPMPPERARTNGHSARPARRRASATHGPDARSSS